MKSSFAVVLLLFAALAASGQGLVNGGRGYPQPNEITTGTIYQGTAIINSAGNAIRALTTNTAVKSYIVLSATSTSGSAILAAQGTMASCTMDSTNASGAAGYFVVNSIATTAECHAQAAAPSYGTWVIGFLHDQSTTLGVSALVEINGFFSLPCFNAASSVATPLNCNGPQGIPVDATNPTTLLYTDRANYLNWTGGANMALPAATGNFGFNFPFIVQNNTSLGLVLTPTAPNNIDGGTSQAPSTVPPGYAGFLYQDNTPNWFSVKLPTLQAFPSCPDANGNHLNFSVGTFTCGTSGGGGSTGWYRAASPTFTPALPFSGSSGTVAIACSSTNTVPWYTLNGTLPPTQASTTTTISSTSTVLAQCRNNSSGGFESSVAAGGVYTVLAGGGTLSLVQGPGSCGGGTNCTCTTSGSAACNMTVNSNPAASNLDLLACISFSGPQYGQNQIVSSNLGTLTKSAVTFGYEGSGIAEGISYILPVNAVGISTTTVSVTMQNSGTNQCAFYEYHPSANAAAVGLDLDMALQNLSTAAPVGPAGTFSGTGDVYFQTYFSSNGFTSPTSVTSPYSTNAFLGNNFGAATAITTQSTVPTWTLGSANGNGVFGLAFGFNPTACLEQGIQSFASGVNGNVPDTTTLNTDTHGGAREGLWGVSTASGTNQVFYSNAQPMPFISSSGRMCNGETYSTSSGIGLSVTGDGTASTQKVTYTWSKNSSNSSTTQPITLSFHFMEDLTNSDLGDNDCAALTGQTGVTGSSLTLNCYNRGGTQRALGIETNSACNTAAGAEQFISISPNTEYNVQIRMIPNVSAAMYVYDTSGNAITGSPTIYANAACASEPVGFAFGHQTSTIPSGKHMWFGSIKWDLTGAVPLIQ